MDTPLRWNGQQQDATGLYYLRARYYDATTGQFLSRDPLTALTLSPYGFADGDPTNAADPTGLICWQTIEFGFTSASRDCIGQGLSWDLSHPWQAAGIAVGSVALILATAATCGVDIPVLAGLGGTATIVPSFTEAETIIAGPASLSGISSALGVSGLAIGGVVTVLDCGAHVDALCAWDAVGLALTAGLSPFDVPDLLKALIAEIAAMPSPVDCPPGQERT
jgi:RHS repeat-associated protein